VRTLLIAWTVLFGILTVAACMRIEVNNGAVDKAKNTEVDYGLINVDKD